MLLQGKLKAHWAAVAGAYAAVSRLRSLPFAWHCGEAAYSALHPVFHPLSPLQEEYQQTRDSLGDTHKYV